MINCLVVDDEQGAIDVLENYIQKIPFLHLVASCHGPLEALDKIYSENIDLVFLDVHMPELSGIDFMKLLKGRIRVILTTAYSEYAIQGFDLNLIDYLLKPISFERFVIAVDKAKLIFEKSVDNLKDESLSNAINQKYDEEFIFVKTDNRIQKLKLSEILLVEGLGNYVVFHTESSKVVSLLTMKGVEELLPIKRFLRVHKSYIVSLEQINYIEGNQLFIRDKKAIPLGETYRNSFFNTLDSYAPSKK